MPDNKAKRGSPDNKRINTKETYEVSYWTKKLDITPQQLVGAKTATGSTSVKKIQDYLKKKGAI